VENSDHAYHAWQAAQSVAVEAQGEARWVALDDEEREELAARGRDVGTMNTALSAFQALVKQAETVPPRSPTSSADAALAGALPTKAAPNRVCC